MGFEDYISESEAANLAGVSIATLRRFSEAGYLSVESDSDGLSLVSKGKVVDLFGLTNRASVRVPQVAPRAVSAVSLTIAPEVSAVESPYLSTATPASSAPPAESILQSPPDSAAAHREVVAPAETPQLTPPSTVQGGFNPNSPEIVSLRSQDQSYGAPANSEVRSTPTQTLQGMVQADPVEAERLRHLVALYEKLLDFKDQQLEELRRERDWLRVRVEKLEEKQDRDQLLLLSETQIVRKMLTLQSERKSPLRAALEWFGVTPATSVPSHGFGGSGSGSPTFDVFPTSSSPAGAAAVSGSRSEN